MEKLIITPKTKIYDLLEAYPQLEDLLINLAPEFKKLRNPVLRKTIARIASISQAAVIGGLQVEQLVNSLRQEVGQGNMGLIEDSETKFVTERPDWFKPELIKRTIDIGEMLNQDEQPVHAVLSAIKALNDNEILEVIAPFIPAPLIDKTLSLEYKHWLADKGRGEFRVYFQK